MAGGVAADHAAQLDGALWTPMGPGVDNSVYAVDASSGVLYAGGAFESSAGAAVNHVARWHADSWEPLGAGMNDDVATLTTYNGAVIAGGSFTLAGDVAANKIAQWNTVAPLGRRSDPAWIKAFTRCRFTMAISLRVATLTRLGVSK